MIDIVKQPLYKREMPRIVDASERRERVAAVAERVIAERGLDAGVRDVAREGGWSTSVVTHYFADKRELLDFTLARTIERAAARIEKRIRAGTPRLTALLEENLPLDERRRRQWRTIIAFWGRAVADERLARRQRRRHEGFRAELETALMEALPGRPKRAHVQLEAQRLFALIDGLAVQAAFEAAAWPPRRQLEVVGRHLEELGLSEWLPGAGASDGRTT